MEAVADRSLGCRPTPTTEQHYEDDEEDGTAWRCQEPHRNRSALA